MNHLRITSFILFLLNHHAMSATNGTNIFNKTHPEKLNIAKIVGGTKVIKDIHRYPWFASYYGHGGLEWWNCGGILITSEYGTFLLKSLFFVFSFYN